MKKVIFTFSVFALVLTGAVSCSSDDNSSEQQKLQTLVLSAKNGNEVAVNEEVTLLVTVGTEEIKHVQIEVNGSEVENPHIFSEAGSYKVIAKKKGYNQSNELTITVAEGAIEKTLSLSVNKSTITVGEAVEFTVKDGEEVITDADLFIGEEKVTTPFTFTQEGEFVVVAKKQGYRNSNEITITVEAAIEKTLNLTVDKSMITVGEAVAFTVKDEEEVITDADLFMGEEKITTPFTFTQEGVFVVIAKKQGYTDSNPITITVEAPVDDRAIVGTWIPIHVNVKTFGATIADMPYPKQENCQDDTLTFNSDQTVQFVYHIENCAVESTGDNWEINEAGNLLNMTLFGQLMKVNVVENTASKLVISGRGDQFEELIPILVPELAGSVPSGILRLATVQLELKK